jgi:hypothetical protein
VLITDIVMMEFIGMGFVWAYNWVYWRLEVFTAVTMKNRVFWDVMLCGSCKNRRFGGT